MGVDKARHDRFIAILRDRETRRQQRLTLLPAAEPDDGALVEQQQTVGNVPQAFVELLRFLHAGGDIKKIATNSRGELQCHYFLPCDDRPSSPA